MSSPLEIVDQYFTTFKQKDLAAMRALLDDNVLFQGPVATIDNAEDFIFGMQMLTKNMKDVERQALFGQGEDVCQVYDMLLIEPEIRVPVAQWIKVRDGKVVMVRAYSDARPFLPK